MASVDVSKSLQAASDELFYYVCGPCEDEGNVKEAKRELLSNRDDMASVDGSKSLQSASDELFDYVCGPCEDEGKVKEAKQYCGVCSVLLCDPCERYHRKLPTTKNHKVVPAHTVSVGSKRRLSLYCGCKNNREPEYYCDNHNDVICTPCKDVKHHKCRTVHFQQKCSGYKSSQIDAILSKTKCLKDTCDRLKQRCSANKKELVRSKDICQDEINALRKELNDFLDRLEFNMLKELNSCEDEKRQQIDKQIEVLTNALQMLDTDYKTLAKAKVDGRKNVMFAADVQASKTIRDCKSRLADLESDIAELMLSFEKNKKLADLQSEIKSFGTINKIDKKNDLLVGEKILLLGMQSRREVKVRLADDAISISPSITGCALMPDGYIVMCDHSNSKLKSFDNSWDYQESISISAVFDVSVVDPNTVIVTVPYKKKLQYVQILPQLQLGRSVQLDSACWGICVSGDDIYVTCYTSNGSEIRVFCLDGTEKSRVPVDMNSSPYYITLSPSGEKIFFTDYNMTKVATCITVDSKIVYKYQDDNLKSAIGMHCDSKDNLYVCDLRSNSVHAITADGKSGGTLLTSRDALFRPVCMAYRSSDNELIIGCSGLDHLLVYNMKI